MDPPSIHDDMPVTVWEQKAGYYLLLGMVCFLFIFVVCTQHRMWVQDIKRAARTGVPILVDEHCKYQVIAKHLIWVPAVKKEKKDAKDARR